MEEESDIALWYAELAKYYDLSNADFTEALAILRNNINVVKKDVSAPKALVELYNLNGEYDEAIKFLNSHHFRTWEGGREIYWHYVDAHTLKAIQLMDNKKYEQALTHLDSALLYPENLEVGKASDDERNALVYYYMGIAYDKMGKPEKAKASYQKSVASESRSGMYDLLYYQAKSHEKLGNRDKANEMFNNLISQGQAQREAGTNNTLIAVEEGSSGNNKNISNSYYLEALGNKGLGNKEEARKLLEAALNEYNNNLWAKVMMNGEELSQ